MTRSEMEGLSGGPYPAHITWADQPSPWHGLRPPQFGWLDESTEDVYAGITNGAVFIGRGIPLAPFHQRPWRVRDADLCLRTRRAPRRLS